MFDKTVSSPVHSDNVKHSFPTEHVLLLTMNRPKSLNAMDDSMERDLGVLLDWFERESTLWSVRSFSCSSVYLLITSQGWR
jgi:enoyl-CoA hydratase/carnithine racemase